MWGPLRNSTQLLAVITPCKTNQPDASKALVHYKQQSAPIVTDIRNIKSIIGCVYSRGRWGIIDRSMNLVEGSFLATDKDVFWDPASGQSSESELSDSDRE